MASYKLIDLELVEQLLRHIQRAVTFARDTNDRLRVIVDSGTVIINAGNSTSTLINAGQQPALFGSNSWNIMDSRETMRQATQAQWAITRNRWTIT